MREADDAALQRAQLYVDTDGGKIRRRRCGFGRSQSGAIDERPFAATCYGLSRRPHARAGPDDAITLSSPWAALEDLAAAMLVWRRFDV